MQRAEKAVKPAAHTLQRQPAVERAAARAAPRAFADQRPGAIAQRELLQLIAQSPRVDASRPLNQSIHGSPGMQAQRQQVLSMFGEAVQRQVALEDEEPVQGRFLAAQRQTAEEEEEPLQGRFDTAQRQETEEDELQMKAAPTAAAQREAETATPPNRTGLPDGLKTGIERLAGMAMDHVQVHYNSSRPAQLNALAYAQGSEIHVAPGQERHLPHEAWHVVQQAQGRVQPTLQMSDGVPVNDDKGLEREADVMGAKATDTMHLGAPSRPVQARRDPVQPGPEQKLVDGLGHSRSLNVPSPAGQESRRATVQKNGFGDGEPPVNPVMVDTGLAQAPRVLIHPDHKRTSQTLVAAMAKLDNPYPHILLAMKIQLLDRVLSAIAGQGDFGDVVHMLTSHLKTLREKHHFAEQEYEFDRKQAAKQAANNAGHE